MVDISNGGDGQDGKRHVLWGLVGMFIMFSVWGIIGFISETIGVNQNDIKIEVGGGFK